MGRRPESHRSYTPGSHCRYRPAATVSVTNGPGMDRREYELLTARERDCLRMLSRDREPHEIAAELEIAPGTLANHIKNARAKLGGIGRYQAARDLRAYEELALGLADGSDQAERASSPTVFREASLTKDMHEALGAPHEPARRQPVGNVMVREEREAFSLEEAWVGQPRPDRSGASSRNAGGLQTVLLIAGIIAAITVCASLAFSIAEGAQHLANLMDTPRR